MLSSTSQTQMIIKVNSPPLSTSSKVTSLIDKYSELNDRMRAEIVSITEKSGVQVEPSRVTKILDMFKETISNLVMCGVPGAGGDDAVTHHILFIGVHYVLIYKRGFKER